ncbi:uncharacterized mitochondrial protein AtMg00810-like [Telopea speciosissima]|uniref:uncharacterized mitochondrial protein AtMg00810-like n=1 Tax=Telopea speciosissima TaxID=54955 RepID=UPI001CC5B79A|nr:uncharacterized mitochondrial protein AtMg00810-like [Telopea speciosissima]
MANKDPNWKEAMVVEIKALELNRTRSITDLPPGKKSIGCKWVYKIKRRSDSHRSFEDIPSFSVSNQGSWPVKYFLGIEVARAKQGIHLSQCKYALDILTDVGLLGGKPCNFLMDTTIKLTPDDGTLLEDQASNRRLIGRLLYLTITRPDITRSMSSVSS